MLVCLRADGDYTMVITESKPPGSLKVVASLFPDMDIEAAKCSTHVIIDQDQQEVVYFGNLDDCQDALIRYADFGLFIMAPFTFNA